MPLETNKLLWDMQVAARHVADFARGRTEENYLTDVMLRSAVERQFEILGEALSQLRKLDPATASRITDHMRIIGFRNQLIHGTRSSITPSLGESFRNTCRHLRVNSTPSSRSSAPRTNDN
jgi:uncharacterized protein with HEPN domain